MLSVIRRQFQWPPMIVLAFTLTFTACNDDSGNGPVDPGTRFAEIADALAAAEDATIDSNAELSASLDYFVPYIAATLGLGAKVKIAESSGQQTCLPAGVAGNLYKFNGSLYVADLDTSVSELDIRFRIYQLYLGEPVISQPIGHIEFSCFDDDGRVAETRIVSGTVLIASLAYSELTSMISGGIRSSDGTHDILVNGAISIEGDLQLNFLLDDDDIQATYEFPLDDTGTRIAHAAIIGPYPEPDWGFFTDVTVNTSEVVTSGGAYYREEPELLGKGAACISSGTLAFPVFTAPTSECPASQPDHLTVTASQLADMAAAYNSLHELWDGLQGLVQADLAILEL